MANLEVNLLNTEVFDKIVGVLSDIMKDANIPTETRKFYKGEIEKILKDGGEENE